MTPERVAQLVAWWVRLYTLGLPSPIAQRRVDEIDADVHDHISHERGSGISEGRIALGLLSRMVRGLFADTSWRRRHAARSSRSVIRVGRVVALILLLPLVGVITGTAAWGPGDFVVAGVLLMGTGLMLDAVRKAASTTYRLAAGVGIASSLFLVWTILAVGVIGEEGDPADLMYGGVLAVGILGALVARFRPLGMARALLAMAVAQALVAVIALLAGKHESPISSVGEIVGVNAMFVVLFVGSALLFRRAGRAGLQAPSR